MTNPAPKSIPLSQLEVGMAAEMTRAITEAHVRAFAEISGDINPIHIDEAYAAATPFKTRIAHGIFTASHISALVANELPGAGSIYIGQTLSFMRPVPLGSEVTTRVEIIAIDRDKNRVVLDCLATVAGKAVLKGEATIMAPQG